MRIIFMRMRITEVRQDSISNVPGNVSAEALYGGLARFLVGKDYFSQVLSIQSLRKLGGADKITEHHCELAALGFTNRSGCVCGRKCR